MALPRTRTRMTRPKQMPAGTACTPLVRQMRETGLSHRFRWIIGPPSPAVNGVLRRYFAWGLGPAAGGPYSNETGLSLRLIGWHAGQPGNRRGRSRLPGTGHGALVVPDGYRPAAGFPPGAGSPAAHPGAGVRWRDGDHAAFGGVPLDRSLSELNLARPDLVRDLHAAYLAAGADIVQTNTFDANRPRLARAGLQDSVAEINIAGARLAREAVGKPARPRWWRAASGR